MKKIKKADANYVGKSRKYSNCERLVSPERQVAILRGLGLEKASDEYMAQQLSQLLKMYP